MRVNLVVALMVGAVITPYARCGGSCAGQDLDGVAISMKRTACYGSCPIYEWTVYGDGTVIYEGWAHVRLEGTGTGTISKRRVRRLLREFEHADFHTLDDAYDRPWMTDTPSTITSLTMDGVTKTVRHVHGDERAPEKLTRLEGRIDEILGTERYIR